jgi:hypothetical protein
MSRGFIVMMIGMNHSAFVANTIIDIRLPFNCLQQRL